MVAHLTGGQGVAGSNPVIPTNFVFSPLGPSLAGLFLVRRLLMAWQNERIIPSSCRAHGTAAASVQYCRMKIPAIVASVVITSALIASAGCDGLYMGGCCGPAPTILNGKWVGSTDQGKPITFTYNPDGTLTGLTVAYRLNQADCEQEGVDSPTAMQALGAQAYQYTSQTSPMTVKIKAAFQSSTPPTASGTATWTAIPSVAPCAGDTKISWTATKQ